MASQSLDLIDQSSETCPATRASIAKSHYISKTKEPLGKKSQNQSMIQKTNG